MPRYVAFLRGINLGKRRLAMTRLQSLVQEIGYAGVETFIASGNVVFSTPQSNTATVETTIARHLEKSLGYPVDTFVRSLKDVDRIAGTRVFPQDGQEGITIHVAFLHQPLPKETVAALGKIQTGYDEFRVHGRELHWLCHGKMSDSKVWTLPEVKALKMPSSTMRNITSLRKLVARFAVTQD
ncbi:MAG: DUF1697 domain-containing protein [Verrucomicrobiales bacterium]|nr:DUF1697 domain-containing protein [Verrucomicrobiales bacterium]